MKRDMDLIRALLLKLEDIGSSHKIMAFTADDEEIAIKGYDEDQIAYHLVLLHEAGLIDSGGVRSGRFASGEFSFRRLTWAGHEFLDGVRDPEVWRKTKAETSKVGGWTFGLIKDVATAVIKETIKEKTGLPI